MSTYQELKGLKVKYLSSDTSGDRVKEGEVFYNSTDFNLKSFVSTAAWHSSANLLTARNNGSGAGTITAGLAVGGNYPDNMRLVEEYNGSGWASATNSPYDAQLAASIGTQTAAATFGGISPPGKHATTVEYDGTNWTSGGNLNTARAALTGCGTQTAGLATRGDAPNPSPPPDSTGGQYTEEYNGTSWTNGNNTNDARRNSPASFGTQTAAVACGGGQPNENPSNTTEEYDGTNWTSVNNMNTARLNLAGAGILTSGIIFGGQTGPGGGPVTNATEQYDGTNWTTAPNMGTARAQRAGTRAGSNQTEALAHGGYTTTQSAATEEFTVSLSATTSAAWASGGNLNTGGRAGAAGSGIQTASIIAGGGLGTVLNNTESYNGSTWTNLPTLGTARGYMAGATNAPYTATVVFGGATGPGGPYVGNSEEYSGSSWSEGNDLNNSRGYLAGFGTQTAAAAAGGTAPNPSPPSRQSHVEEYNGSSWSEVTDVPAAANAWGGCGTQTAGLVIGDVPMKGLIYDGTNWTTIPTLNSQGNYNKVFGTTASAMTCGRNPGKGTDVEEWNGTTWFTQPPLATPRFNGGQTGTTTAGLVAGSPVATEEFTGETTAIRAVKTIDFD